MRRVAQMDRQEAKGAKNANGKRRAGRGLDGVANAIRNLFPVAFLANLAPWRSL
jgi:hypothetical protein